MNELPQDRFDAYAQRASWMNKVSRRETREQEVREAQRSREHDFIQYANSYKEFLSRNAERRNNILMRSQAERQDKEEELRRQAEAYRARLRGYLRPELRES